MDDLLLIELAKQKNSKIKNVGYVDTYGRGSRGMQNTIPYMPGIVYNKGAYSMHDTGHEWKGYEEEYNPIFKQHRTSSNHFDEMSAKEVVAGMYHWEGDRRVSGEKFTLTKAHEVLTKYKNILPEDVEVYDVYVALNAQYHDYCPLFKTWFRLNSEPKIIESAMVFWFCDVDYSGESKIFEYFMS